MRKKEDKIVKIVNLIKENKTTFLTVAGFVIGITVFTLFVYYRLQITRDTASAKLAVAVNYVAAGDAQNGLKLIDEVITKYSRTPSAYRAMLMKSNFFISQKKYDDAEQMLKNYIKNAKPETLKPLAYPTLILVYDNTGQLEKAIETSKDFLSKYPDNYLVLSITENLARLYELAGNETESLNLYKKIIDSYPNTDYAERAKSKVK